MPAKTIINEREFLELLNNGMLPVEIARHFGVSPAAITKKIKKYRPNPVVQKYTRKRDKQDEQRGKRYTEKKAKYVESRLEGKKPAQAAMIAYDCKTPESAAVIGHKLEKDPQVNRAIADCLLDEGVTPTFRAKKIRTILDNGSFDHQLKALDHTAKLSGDYQSGETPSYSFTKIDISITQRPQVDQTSQVHNLSKLTQNVIEGAIEVEAKEV